VSGNGKWKVQNDENLRYITCMFCLFKIVSGS
jgi:hypothetical protein